MSDIRLDGKVAVVTGAGGGLGRAHALLLASRGARVVVNDLGGAVDGTGKSTSMADHVVEEIRKAGGEAAANYDSVSTAEGGRAIVETAIKAFGRIDILINNAGAAASAPVPRTDDGMWARLMEVNLGGVFRCTREALPEMVASGWGRVITIASIAARIGQPYIAAYTASKHGVIGFTRAAAMEVAARGVTVNAICPGYVATDMADLAIENIVRRTGRTVEEAREALVATTPQRRLFEADEVAALAVFLASDAAHGINGQAINLDGGAVQS
jgi:NAD(P)-dependent dehydrogenase (short-subunit alcohol dehydrogenase family)